MGDIITLILSPKYFADVYGGHYHINIVSAFKMENNGGPTVDMQCMSYDLCGEHK